MPHTSNSKVGRAVLCPPFMGNGGAHGVTHLTILPIWKSAFLLCLLTASLISKAEEMALLELSGRTMGTTWSVKLADTPVALKAAELRQATQRLLDELEQTFSTYRSDSEITRFNASTPTNWLPVSLEMADVVERALKVSGETDGVFDITVGPLVELWGFGPERHSRVPSAEQIARAKARAGWRKLEVRMRPPALRKSQADVAIDLSGIAKGYAVDRVVELLQARGLTNALAQVGGETFALGQRSAGKGWRVGIEQPLAEGRAVQEVIELASAALSTSGDYRNFHEINGRRYAHIIDPHTGWPVPHKGASAIVIAPTVAEADALATALFVLGPERGLALADKLQLKCAFIERTGKKFVSRPSQAFKKMVGQRLVVP